MKQLEHKLLNAIEIDSLKQVIDLLNDGVDPNFKNHLGNSPLYVSIATSKTKIAELLLQHNAKVDYKNNERNETSLYHFVARMAKTNTNLDGSIQLANLLLTYGADPNFKRTKTDLSLLHDAVIKQNFQLVELLLKKGANVDECDNKLKVTPLCFPSNIGIVKLLISYNSNVNHIQKSGKPLLFEYLELNEDQDPKNSMKNLLIEKVNLNELQIIERLELLIQDRDNKTLMNILNKLNNEDINLVNELIIYSVKWANQEILLELLKLEGDTNYYSSKQGTSALFEAVSYNDIETVTHLVKSGAEYKKMHQSLRDKINKLRLSKSIEELIGNDN
jgi:ankyrin repeat protein